MGREWKKAVVQQLKEDHSDLQWSPLTNLPWLTDNMNTTLKGKLYSFVMSGLGTTRCERKSCGLLLA